MAEEHAQAIIEVRALLKERGTISNRDFEKADRKQIQSYRGRKDSALALYYLWRVGDVMTHHRERFERVYALTENVAPEVLIQRKDPGGNRPFSRQERNRLWRHHTYSAHGILYGRGEPDRAAKKILEKMLADGEIIELNVEGWKAPQYALGEDAKLLLDLSAGRSEGVEGFRYDYHGRGCFSRTFGSCQRARACQRGIWVRLRLGSVQAATLTQVRLLCSARLMGDPVSSLVSTASWIEQRTHSSFSGFWLEDKALGKDQAFAEALSRGFARFVGFPRRGEDGCEGDLAADVAPSDNFLRVSFNFVTPDPGPKEYLRHLPARH